MQHSNSNTVTEFLQLSQSLLNRFYDNPKVEWLMKSRIGQHLRSNPFLAHTMFFFTSMALLPVGLFLSFAVVTSIMMALGFVFLEVFLLFVGGLILLCVLSGTVLFSLMLSFIFNVLRVSISNILKNYHPHLTKHRKVQEEETEGDTSKPKEM